MRLVGLLFLGFVRSISAMRAGPWNCSLGVLRFVLIDWNHRLKPLESWEDFFRFMKLVQFLTCRYNYNNIMYIYIFRNYARIEKPSIARNARNVDYINCTCQVNSKSSSLPHAHHLTNNVNDVFSTFWCLKIKQYLGIWVKGGRYQPRKQIQHAPICHQTWTTCTQLNSQKSQAQQRETLAQDG